MAGIQRRRRGKHFSYRSADGKALRDAAVLQRIAQLAIPPAWREVWICPWPNGHLQATGLDARGRKQYRYHAQWQAGRGQTKFARLAQFGDVLPRIRARVQRALAGDDTPTRTRVLATLVRLLDTTWLRIGNAEYARSNQSYGLSTLRNHHADVRGAALELDFVGKSGVHHRMRLNDRRVARVVRRCRELPGQDLFQYVDAQGDVHGIGSADVNDWLAEAAGCRVTAKDFRTWHGTVLALALTLQAADAPDGAAAQRPHNLATAVVTAVAQRLGNTPAVCRKAYIHPDVLALATALGAGDGGPALHACKRIRQAPAVRGLHVSESHLLGLLQMNTTTASNRRTRPTKPRAKNRKLEAVADDSAGAARRPR